jgi:hypothetical protein
LTSEIIPWNKNQLVNFTESVDFPKPSTSQSTATAPDKYSEVHLKRVTGVNITSVAGESGENHISELTPINRIYPHVFDEDIKAGQVLVLLKSAINDANDAIDAFGEPDLQSVSTRLTNIAVAMSKAHSLTDFNESLGGVVSYIRRAMLAASKDDLSRSALNSLLHVLKMMAVNPMIDLDDATDLVDKLSNEGWKGEHKLADEIIAALVAETEIESSEIQALLFPENQIATS